MAMRFCFIFILLTLSTRCFSQDAPKNAVFFELGGNGILYSFNYERQFNNQLLGRIGISYFSNDLQIPLTFGKLFGEEKHHFEVSSGITYQNQLMNDNYDYGYYYTDWEPVRKNVMFLTGFVGYRFQKPEGHFLFRAGLTPLFEIYDSVNKASPGVLFIWGGLSFGHRF
jgi:hypothetical protein